MRVPIYPNFDDNGGLFGGLIKKRNAVEAGAFLVFLFLVYKIFFRFSILALSIFIIIAVLGAATLLVGLGDQSFCSVLMNKIKYRKEKTVVTLMKPSDEEHY